MRPRIWSRRPSDRPGRAAISSAPEGGSRAWLASILRRRVADHWRRPRPPALVADDQRLEIELPADDPCRDELTDEMQHALNRLPAELKETLILVVVAELTHQEAAEMLGVPLGTVLSRVSRARNRLREYLTPTQNAEARISKSETNRNHKSEDRNLNSTEFEFVSDFDIRIS